MSKKTEQHCPRCAEIYKIIESSFKTPSVCEDFCHGTYLYLGQCPKCKELRWLESYEVKEE